MMGASVHAVQKCLAYGWHYCHKSLRFHIQDCMFYATKSMIFGAHLMHDYFSFEPRSNFSTWSPRRFPDIILKVWLASQIDHRGFNGVYFGTQKLPYMVIMTKKRPFWPKKGIFELRKWFHWTRDGRFRGCCIWIPNLSEHVKTWKLEFSTLDRPSYAEMVYVERTSTNAEKFKMRNEFFSRAVRFTMNDRSFLSHVVM